MTILLRHDDTHISCKPEWYGKKKNPSYYLCLTVITKCEILIVGT